jgi:hypothetical protein
LSVAPSRSAPASDAIAPLSKRPATERPAMGIKPNESRLQSARIEEFFESDQVVVVKQLSQIQSRDVPKSCENSGLARFPIRWNHLIEKNSRQFKNLGSMSFSEKRAHFAGTCSSGSKGTTTCDTFLPWFSFMRPEWRQRPLYQRSAQESAQRGFRCRQRPRSCQSRSARPRIVTPARGAASIPWSAAAATNSTASR